MMRLLHLFLLAILSYGLWAHDWRIIGTSLLVILVWPTIQDDVLLRDKCRERKQLDRLWADDDLSESA